MIFKLLAFTNLSKYSVYESTLLAFFVREFLILCHSLQKLAFTIYFVFFLTWPSYGIILLLVLVLLIIREYLF